MRVDKEASITKNCLTIICYDQQSGGGCNLLRTTFSYNFLFSGGKQSKPVEYELSNQAQSVEEVSLHERGHADARRSQGHVSKDDTYVSLQFH